jgi:2',3'-cyclic-nucleotide 2'-phosphodiesterase (5'-nucleotidase family)
MIIGGHTNTFLWNGPVPNNLRFVPKGEYPTVVRKARGEKVLVVQTNGYGRYLGDLEMSFDSNGKVVSWSNSPILLKNSIPMDQNLKSSVEFYRKQVMGKMDTKVGSTQTFLDGERPKVRLEECSFGSFLADAMAHEMKVEIAFVNSGSIKGSFYEGMLLLKAENKNWTE